MPRYVYVCPTCGSRDSCARTIDDRDRALRCPFDADDMKREQAIPTLRGETVSRG